MFHRPVHRDIDAAYQAVMTAIWLKVHIFVDLRGFFQTSWTSVVDSLFFPAFLDIFAEYMRILLAMRAYVLIFSCATKVSLKMRGLRC
jgi:hypothetical protein